MYRIILPCLILGSVIVTYGDSAIQTNWSGGSGVSGPVVEFSDQFDNETDIRWNSDLGDIELHREFFQHTISSFYSNSYSVYSEDIDGDGDMDVLAALFQSSNVSWFENIDGSGTSWTEHLIAEDHVFLISIYSEDLDSDGDMDILGATLHDDEIIWWENIDGTGISWTEHIITGTYDGASCVYSVDIDGDGDMDVLGAASLADDITWWENIDGTGTSWTEHTVDGNYDGACMVYSDDLDDDGDMDILGTAFDGDEIVWWENTDGSGTSWTVHTIDGNYDGACAVYSDDIDGDGDMDVLGTAFESGEATWWENCDGSGTSWLKHTVNDDFAGARSIFAGDIDEDGDMDIFGAALLDAEIAFWENLDGSGTSWAEYTVDHAYFFGNSVYLADIDGDSTLEILGTLALTGICWWEVTGYSLTGVLESSILDVQVEPSWDYLNWNSETPAGTSVAFQVRSSDDHANMGDWSDTIFTPCSLAGILVDSERYVQYRILLETVTNNFTPTLNNITISWNLLGINETAEPIPQTSELLNIAPNPSDGSPLVRFGLPVPAFVGIRIFDLSGRLVIEIHGDEYSAGFHEVQLVDLNSGIYFCRMTSGEFTVTQRFVVIE